MKKIVMLVCVCAFGIATFAGCTPGNLAVDTPNKGTKPPLTTDAADGGANIFIAN